MSQIRMNEWQGGSPSCQNICSYLYNSITSRVCCLENVLHCPPPVQQVQSHIREQVSGREEGQDFLVIIVSVQRNQAYSGDIYGDLRTDIRVSTDNQWWSEGLQWRWLPDVWLLSLCSTFFISSSLWTIRKLTNHNCSFWELIQNVFSWSFNLSHCTTEYLMVSPDRITIYSSRAFK